MSVVGGIRERLRRDEGAARWYVWAIIIAVLVILLLIAAARKADSTLLVGKVESLKGNIATVSVAELNRSFDLESVDPDLKVGTTVIVQVQGQDAALEATSPQMVKLIVTLKGLVP